MAIQHNALTGADLHEPKGIASASSGSVYKANGAGSGSWQKVSVPVSLGKLITGSVADRVILPVPVAGTVKTFSVTPASADNDQYPSGDTTLTVELRDGADLVLTTIVFTKGSDPVRVTKSVSLDVVVPTNSTLYAMVTGGFSATAAAHCYVAIGMEV